MKQLLTNCRQLQFRDVFSSDKATTQPERKQATYELCCEVQLEVDANGDLSSGTKSHHVSALCRSRFGT